MILCQVTGTLVATQKNEHLRSETMLVCQPVALDGTPIGRDFVALDSVSAGVGDRVLVVVEGAAAAQVLKNKKLPVHSVVVAVVDGMEVAEGK
jgi:ethanolamine utilization protein EutN